LFNLAGIETKLVDVVILLRHVKFGTVDSGDSRAAVMAFSTAAKH
jgi:hypothetical protein